ncbi:MAG: hypothetical protein ACK4JB_01820 [Reyranella sp.]
MSRRALQLSLDGPLAMGTAMDIVRFVQAPIPPPKVEAIALTKAQTEIIASASFLGYLTGCFRRDRGAAASGLRHDETEALALRTGHVTG